MTYLEMLAERYQTDSVDVKIEAIAAGMVHSDVIPFINQHREGWLGVNGNFARQLARVLTTFDGVEHK